MNLKKSIIAIFLFFLGIMSSAQIPSNDECSYATLINSTTDYFCGYNFTQGTTLNATNSGMPETCGAVGDDDVWYKFAATHEIHYIYVGPNMGNDPDLVVSVYNGSCGALDSITCTNSNGVYSFEELILSGLTIGDTIYVRIFDGSSGVSDLVFDLCVYSPPINDDCEGAIDINPISNEYSCLDITTVTSTNSGVTTGSCNGIPDDDIWYSFTAIQNFHNIHFSTACEVYNSGEFIMELRTSPCIGSSIIDCTSIPYDCQTNTISRNDFMVGVTYHIRLFGSDTLTPSNGYLCIESPPIETEDNCITAELLSVNGSVCNMASYSNNIASSTSTATPVTMCNGGPYFDLWYKFVATQPRHIVNIEVTEGGDLAIDGFSGECNMLSFINCVNNTAAGDEILLLENLLIGDTVFIRVFDANNTGDPAVFNICILTPPENDFCDNAELISVTNGISCFNPVQGDTRSATGSGGCGGGIADDDVWFKFVATADTHAITVNVFSIIDPVIELFDSCTGASLSCTMDNQYFFNNAVVGNTYYIRIYSASAEGNGNFSICVSTPPANAQCLLAFPLTPSATCNDIQSSYNNTGAPDKVYFKFNAAFAGYTIVVRSSDINFNPIISINQYCDPVNEVSLLFNKFQLQDNEWRFTYGNFTIGEEYIVAMEANGQGNYFICVLEPNVHDECANALSLNTNTEYSLSTYACTQSEGSLFCTSNQNDFWAKFVPNVSQTYYVNLIPENPSQFIFGEVLTGTDCNGLSNVACINESGYVSFSAMSGTNYYIRIWIKQNEGFNGIIHKTGEFKIHISNTEQSNNNCAGAITLTHSTGCSYVAGSTYGASKDNSHSSCTTNSNSADVWYKFTATSSNIRIKVKNLSENFNPVIKLFQATNCSNLSFKICADHFSIGEEDILQYSGVNGATYYILITENGFSNNAGNFEICVTSNTDREFILAKYTQTQSDLSVGSFFEYTGEIKAYFVGSGSLNQITQLKGHVTPNHDFVSNISAQFDPAPNGTISFFGNDTIAGDSSFVINGIASVSGANSVFSNSLYIYSDTKCNATVGENTGVKIDSIKVGSISHPVKNVINGYKTIIGFTDYYTDSDGNWNNVDTWTCDILPPNLPTSNVFVRNNITLDGIHTIGNLTILDDGNLSIPSNTALTLGLSSQGGNTTHTSKTLAMGGKLKISGGTLNVNGGLSIADSFIMSSGIINIDPNNGTNTSYNWHTLAINTTKVNVTGGDINILDPPFDPIHNSINIDGFSDYPVVSIKANVKLGGGDDTNISNLKGFRIRSKTPNNNQMPATFGLMHIDSLSIVGGRYAQRRHFSPDLCLYAGSVYIENDCETYITNDHTPLIITKNFINNGYCMINDDLSPYRSIYFTTSIHNSGFVNPAIGSSIERVFGGTGLFSNSIANGYPINSEGNILRGISLNNTIRLQTPLTIFDRFELHGGKLFTSDSTLLTLGSDAPINVAWCEYLGVEISGIVGPVKKWYNGQSIFNPHWLIPFYDRQCYLNFTNTNLGYVLADFIEEAPHCEGLPLINEQATDIRGVSPSGYWKLTGNNVSGNYSIFVNAFNFQRMDGSYIFGDYNNIRLIRKNVSNVWGLSGSMTTNGPTNMFSVTAEGVNGIADFGIGIADTITYYKSIKDGNWHTEDTWNQCSFPAFETTLDVEVNNNVMLMQNANILSNITIKNGGDLNIDNNSILQVGSPVQLRTAVLEEGSILGIGSGVLKVYGTLHHHQNSETNIESGSLIEVRQN